MWITVNNALSKCCIKTKLVVGFVGISPVATGLFLIKIK